MTLSSNLDSGRDSGGTPFLVRLVVVVYENTNLGRPLLCVMTNRENNQSAPARNNIRITLPTSLALD